MAHLLVVDDEDLTVKRLQVSIDWKCLEIDQVFTAFSMSQAQKIFSKERIDIMLCDIEMPAGSGLELLHWVRDQGYDTICIFLTGHANFSYAKEALTLETMEYILKPVSYDEVKRVIKKAVAQLKEQQSEQVNQRLTFFGQLVQGEILPQTDSILRTANRFHVTVSSEDTCIPVLIASKENFQKQGTDGYWDTKPAVANIAADCFPQLFCPPLLLAHQILLLFPGNTTQDSLSQELPSFLNTTSATLSIKLLLCVGRKVSLEGLHPEVFMLLQTEHDTVKASGIFFFPTQGEKSALSQAYPQPDYSLWMILLDQGDPNGVTTHIKNIWNPAPSSTAISYLDSTSTIFR